MTLAIVYVIFVAIMALAFSQLMYATWRKVRWVHARKTWIYGDTIVDLFGQEVHFINIEKDRIKTSNQGKISYIYEKDILNWSNKKEKKDSNLNFHIQELADAKENV